jgi:endonuclease YncB( thermonuclease family)
LIRNAKAVRLERMQRDKYFRIDAVVLVDGVDLGALLLSEGLAKPWNGQGPRPKW